MFLHYTCPVQLELCCLQPLLHTGPGEPSSGKGGKGGKGRGKGKGGGKGGRGGGNGRGRGRGGNPDQQSPPPAQGGSSKSAREVQATQRILLECEQTVHNIQEGLSVKTKQVTGLSEKIKARLSPALVALYTQGYDPSSDDPPSEGFLALEKLRQYEQILLKIEPFIKGLEVWAAAKAATATCKDFTPPKSLAELVLQREVDRAAKAKDFATIKALLQCSSAEEGSNEKNFEDEAKRVAFREREITRLAAELMRQDNQVDAVADLIKSVVESALLPQESQIMEEFKQLLPLFKPLDLDFPIDRLQALLTRFRTERTLKLHKVLNFFTTGLKILDGAAAGLASRSKDSDLKRRLDELNENAGLLRVPDAVEREDYKTLKAKAEKFQSLFETLTDIKTNGTMDFIRRETGVLQVVDDKMKALFTYKHEVGRNLQDDPLPLKGVCEASLVEVVRFEDPSTHCCTVTAGPSLFFIMQS